MIIINTQRKLTVGDVVAIKDALNRPEKFTLITFPKKSEMRGSLLKCKVRSDNGKLIKEIYINNQI